MLTRNNPKLRFRADDGSDYPDWEEKKLGKIGEIITGSTPDTHNVDNYNGDKFFVSPADISEQRYIENTKTRLSEQGFCLTRLIKENSILFVCIGSTIGKVAQNKCECATNQQINSIIPFSIYSNDFIYSALENSSKRIASLAGCHAVPIINKTTFSLIKIYIPELPEQQKIADCLSSLDDLIALQSMKIESLRKHKTGIMQQIFSQKFRFKADDRSDYPDWEEKKLWQIGNVVRGSNLSKNDLSDIGNPCIHYGELFTKYQEVIWGVISKTSVNGFKSQYGDILMPTSDVTTQGLGRASALQVKNVILGSDMNIIRLYQPQYSIYMSYYLNYQTNEIIKLVSGTTVKHIYPKDIINLIIKMPDIDEQQKIADFLTSLDELIAEQSTKLSALKQHKTGLMQQLFPLAMSSKCQE